jgi:hypothetical protein
VLLVDVATPRAAVWRSCQPGIEAFVAISQLTTAPWAQSIVDDHGVILETSSGQGSQQDRMSAEAPDVRDETR